MTLHNKVSKGMFFFSSMCVLSGDYGSCIAACIVSVHDPHHDHNWKRKVHIESKVSYLTAVYLYTILGTRLAIGGNLFT